MLGSARFALLLHQQKLDVVQPGRAMSSTPTCESILVNFNQHGCCEPLFGPTRRPMQNQGVVASGGAGEQGRGSSPSLGSPKPTGRPQVASGEAGNDKDDNTLKR